MPRTRGTLQKVRGLFDRALHRPRGGLFIAVGVAALAIAGGAAAFAVRSAASDQGLSDGFSAFARLPPAQWPDSMPPIALEHSADYVGVSPTEFLHRFRLLRTGLTLGPARSEGQGELYAYVSDDGQAACMFLTGQSGTCFKDNYAPHVRGVFPEISPGYPGQTPAMTAIVADNVQSVDLSVSGTRTSLPISENSIYADLTGLQAADSLALHITYSDLTTDVISLLNPLDAAVHPVVPR